MEQLRNDFEDSYDIVVEFMSGVNLLLHEIEGNAEDFYKFEKNTSDVKLKNVKDLAKIKDHSFFALVPEK